MHTAEAVGDEGDRGGSPSRGTSRAFSRPRNADAGAYGMAGMQASKTAAAAAGSDATPSPARLDRAGDGVAQRTLVAAPGPAAQRCVVEVVGLEDLQQVVLPEVAELDGAQPRPQQGAGVLGAEVRRARRRRGCRPR